MSGVSKKEDDTFGRDYGLIHEAIITGRKAGWTRDDWTKFAHDESIQRGVLRVIRGEAREQSSKDEMFSPHISLERERRPSCPVWVGAPVYPELEQVGPYEYSLSQIQLWCHPKQETEKGMGGFELCSHFHDRTVLASRLGLADGYAISCKSAAVYKQFFGVKKLCLWKSVSYRAKPDGDFLVPYLRLRDNAGHEWVEINWLGLHTGIFDKTIPAAHFAD